MARRRRKNPLLAVVTNPPPMSHEVQFVGYRHAQDGEDYLHEFGPGVTMKPRANGTVELEHEKGAPLHESMSGQRFLINPPRRRSTMARKAQARHKSGPNKGRFKKGRASAPKRRRNAPAANPQRRRRAPAAKAAPRRRRRNPPRGKFTVRKLTKDLTQGAMDATLILVGKAGTRTIPALLPNLPKEGNLGLAVQALTAVVIGTLAEMVLGQGRGRMVLAGGLSAPVETLAVSLQIPFLADALQPTTGDQQLSAYYGYVQPPQLPPGGDMGAYVQAGADAALEGYDYANSQ